MGEKYDLVILPTAGKNSGALTPQGVKRVESVVRQYKGRKVDAIAIIGGRRIGSLSEAEVYKRCMCGLLPEIESAIAVVDAQEVCTNRDLAEAMSGIDDYLQGQGMSRATCRVQVPTYWDHFKRIKIVLEHLGFQRRNISWIDSNEDRAYPIFLERIMTFITRHDPEWRGPLSWPFVWLASRRLYEK